MNLVEYPQVRVGEAVVRLSLSAEHTVEQLDRLAAAMDWAAKVCQVAFDREVPAFKLKHPSAKL